MQTFVCAPDMIGLYCFGDPFVSSISSDSEWLLVFSVEWCLWGFTPFTRIPPANLAIFWIQQIDFWKKNENN